MRITQCKLLRKIGYMISNFVFEEEYFRLALGALGILRSCGMVMYMADSIHHNQQDPKQ